jgi:hypothetical protein
MALPYVATLLLTGIKALRSFGGKGQLLTSAQLLCIRVATWYPCSYVALGLCVVLGATLNDNTRASTEHRRSMSSQEYMASLLDVHGIMGHYVGTKAAT